MMLGNKAPHDGSPSLQFREAEFKRRYSLIQQEMKALNIDLVILDQPESIFYALGYSMSEGMYQLCLIPREQLPVMVLRSVDSGTYSQRSWINELYSYSDWEDPIRTAQSVITARGWHAARIAIDENSYALTVSRYRSLRAAFQQSEFIDISNFIYKLRATKSKQEIHYLKRAAEIADLSLMDLVQTLEPGITVRKAAAHVAYAVIAHGGDPGVIGPISVGVDDNNMHPPISERPLQQGTILHAEMIPQYNGYSARLMRPICIGAVPRDTRKVAEQLIELQDEQFGALKPGAEAAEIDAVLREGFLARGLKSNYPNISGYSLGYYQQFTARSSDFGFAFHPNASWTVRSGMVFHMYAVAHGLAFSETMLVTKSGSKRLTQMPRKILSSEEVIEAI